MGNASGSRPGFRGWALDRRRPASRLADQPLQGLLGRLHRIVAAQAKTLALQTGSQALRVDALAFQRLTVSYSAVHNIRLVSAVVPFMASSRASAAAVTRLCSGGADAAADCSLSHEASRQPAAGWSKLQKIIVMDSLSCGGLAAPVA